MIVTTRGPMLGTLTADRGYTKPTNADHLRLQKRAARMSERIMLVKDLEDDLNVGTDPLHEGEAAKANAEALAQAIADAIDDSQDESYGDEDHLTFDEAWDEALVAGHFMTEAQEVAEEAAGWGTAHPMWLEDDFSTNGFHVVTPSRSNGFTGF